MTALILLFSFGITMCLLAGIALLLPESSLNLVWKLNPRGHEGFIRLGRWSYAVLGLVAGGCAAAASGLGLRRRWGYRWAVTLLLINLLGDAANAILGGEYRALAGIPVALAILWLLSRPATRRYFE